MKRYICAVLAAALLAPGIWAVGARAQDDAPPPPPPEHSDSDAPHQGTGNGDRMQKRLGLTDEQHEKFSDAMKAHGAAMKTQGEQVRDAVKKLAGDIKAKASDDDLLAGLAALKSAHKAMAEENEKFEESLAAILTPTQRAKMSVDMARMMMNPRREGQRGRKDGDNRNGGDHQGGDQGGGGDHGGPQGGDHDAPQGGGQ